MTNPLPRIDPEFKALIPPLSPEEYAQLEQNILSANKCRDPIILWNSTIVDGHNRFTICAAHDIQFEIEEMNFESRDEAMLWILDNQLGRRNLCDAMKIEVAMCKTKLLQEQAKENQKAAGGDKTRAGALSAKLRKPINMDKTVSEESGVSDGTVKRYVQIKKQASPELLEKVQSGEIKIGTAHRLLESQIQKQLKHINKLYRFIEKHVPIQDDEAANQLIHSRIMDLQKIHKRLMAKQRGDDNNA